MADPIRLTRMVSHPMSARFLMRGQLRDLESHGFLVQLISSPGEELSAAAEREGVRWHEVARPVPNSEEDEERLSSELTELVLAFSPDTVLTSIGWIAKPGLEAAIRAGVPTRLYELNALPAETAAGAARETMMAAERDVYARADRVFSVSSSLRRRYVELGLDPEAKTTVLGNGSSNGVDTARFCPARERQRESARERARADLGIPPDAPVIGWVGRFAQVKGVDDLAEAFFEHLSVSHPDAHLLLVGGPDPYAPVAADLLERLMEDTRVTITGYVDDPSAHFRAMDVFAFPSYREGFPNGPLEAAASGIPVVGYRATGMVDAVVDGETGSLVAPGDVAALAREVDRYLSDPSLAATVGAQGRARAVALFRREMIWERLRTALTQAVSEARADRGGRRTRRVGTHGVEAGPPAQGEFP